MQVALPCLFNPLYGYILCLGSGNCIKPYKGVLLYIYYNFLICTFYMYKNMQFSFIGKSFYCFMQSIWRYLKKLKILKNLKIKLYIKYASHFYIE